MNQNYEILAQALRDIARYEHCNCGCPGAAKGASLDRAHSFQIAVQALRRVGEPIPVMANSFVDPQPLKEGTKFQPVLPDEWYL